MALKTSIRESIAVNIVDTLTSTRNNSVSSATIKKVTREPVVISDLAVTSMPLVFVQSANELRSDISTTTRSGVIEFIVHVYITGNSRDSERNEILEIIDTAISADPTRGGVAMDSYITVIRQITSGEAAPYASMAITIECEYCYTKGKS
jgi:hypothetical protein